MSKKIYSSILLNRFVTEINALINIIVEYLVLKFMSKKNTNCKNDIFTNYKNNNTNNNEYLNLLSFIRDKNKSNNSKNNERNILKCLAIK